MIARAFRVVWSLMMFFKFSNCTCLWLVQFWELMVFQIFKEILGAKINIKLIFTFFFHHNFRLPEETPLHTCMIFMYQMIHSKIHALEGKDADSMCGPNVQYWL